MPPDVLARVMEPFFTTKGPGKGTGLGLSMVAGVTKQLGGGLSIASDVGKGTCVTIFLPRAEIEPVVAVADISAASTRPMMPVHILLVDDDPNTRAVIHEYAAEAGHEVVAVKDGPEALALLDTGRRADVMIIDGTLPGAPTTDVIAQATARRPGLPVLVISGQATQSLDGARPVLAKPFRQDAFNNVLGRLLRQNPSAGNVVPLRPEASKAG